MTTIKSNQVETLPAQKSSLRWSMLKIFGWASLIANITIIGTGGAVRLTGSGLGCPTWPACTPGSLVPTAELTWHSAIEFGNRLMTGVLGIIAIVVLVWKWRHERSDLFKLAIVVLSGIIFQAILGGITVHTGLNPFIVGGHYLASTVLVIITAIFVYRLPHANTARVPQVPAAFIALSHLTTFMLAITTVVGVITTSNGPHSGDKDIVRTGFDASLLAHLHSWPGYILLGLVLIALIWAYSAHLAPRKWYLAYLIALFVQIFVGVYQAREGLPALAVGVHMMLAAITAAIATVALLKNKTNS